MTLHGQGHKVFIHGVAETENQITKWNLKTKKIFQDQPDGAGPGSLLAGQSRPLPAGPASVCPRRGRPPASAASASLPPQPGVPLPPRGPGHALMSDIPLPGGQQTLQVTWSMSCIVQ